MKELNYKILRAALDHLPVHEAPAGIWTTLEAALDLDEQIATDLPNLPEHTPPPAIWAHIEARLDATEDVSSTTRRKPGYSLRPVLWPYAAAAALALLLAAWWFWSPAGSSSTGNAAIAVTQEVVDDQLLDANRETEDEAFALVQALCRQPATVCAEPEFQALKTELDELSSAKATLKTALGNFGDDPELHAQLARIERERSELLRQMMSMI